MKMFIFIWFHTVCSVYVASSLQLGMLLKFASSDFLSGVWSYEWLDYSFFFSHNEADALDILQYSRLYCSILWKLSVHQCIGISPPCLQIWYPQLYVTMVLCRCSMTAPLIFLASSAFFYFLDGIRKSFSCGMQANPREIPAIDPWKMFWEK